MAYKFEDRFVRYDWNKHYGCVACSHPHKTLKQLELF